MRISIFTLCLLWGFFSYAQTTVSGKVTDENGMPVSDANVVIAGKTIGTVTDTGGMFVLETSENLPFTLKVSSIGYAPVSVTVTSSGQEVNVRLQEQETLLNEIVISASRTPERIFESPVTVERFGIREIRNTSSATFYDGLENLKGVDINTSSLTFKSVNTRGFATFANTRFVQLVDGMDNTSPALNFVLGNLVGMSELDVHSVELLPGASSALYGANAFNGILFMTSKSPFDDQGISAYAKSGITSQEAAGDHTFYDFGIRMAHAFSDKFAGKANFSYLRGTDWYAVSEEDVLNPGATRADPDYDGMNIYGDEVSTNIKGVANSMVAQGLLPDGAQNLVPDQIVSRTGYAERNLTDYKAESVKADFALHYRPFADDFEIIYNGRLGRGSTVYQGANRYALRDFFIQQHKLEFRNDNFFVRGYITAEKAGDSYDMRFTGINMNRLWKPDEQWYGEYVGAYLTALQGGAGFAPGDETASHAFARQVADMGRLEPGTPEFKNAFRQVTGSPDLANGSKFQDNTKLRHIDVNYNFSHLTGSFADIQVGGSFREYVLNSSGTIFTDYEGPISYSEYGAYTQVQKKFMDERFKFTGSLRYDKSQLFDGFVSPRFSLGYTAGQDRNHNFRASFQTGFRNPTTQDLFIGLDVGRAILVGSAEENLDRYVRTYDLSDTGAALTGSPTMEVSGRQAYERAFSARSVQAFTASAEAGAPDPSLLAVADVEKVKPEKITAFEVGYRGQLENITIDASVYYNQYKDFIANETVVVPFYGALDLSDPVDPGTGPVPMALIALSQGDFQAYQTYTNSSVDINSYGATVGVDARVFGNYDFGINYTYADFDFDEDKDPDFRPGFNTPKHKVKASFGNTDLFENFGFQVNWRWSDAFFWQASFADGDVPAFSVFDAQFNYRVPSLKSTFKIGAANIGGSEYFTAVGTGLVGSQYYVSWVVNP
ncbi:TonB-dependent receptor [Sinomicrobium weinanense]|uniref:TonB-dependent receptor n=1 Tax=Sinomicrobium weinanense TaxID=2842200 RepID=A0A926JNW1_9FLAO|nr:TonB-dependent receptor [Sinomicrobium weinanense]MBC9794556.1 TonB-dependent receptor [Sinomicrobium weinanense]MBU3124041.1 TonB-dependent receptor [Sinomicrobium weinanense]